jgi:anti-sigma factor RsiW
MTGTPERPEVTEAMRIAYADGRLSRADRALVEAHLANDPERAAEMAHWLRQNEALSALFTPAGREPVPDRLDPHLLAARHGRMARSRWQLAAAALVLLTLGASLGWLANGWLISGPRPEDRLLSAAITAHTLYVNEKRHAVEVAASEEDHLVTWLSSRIRTPIDAPDLSGSGFGLVGGRLLPASAHPEAGPAAQLMYENAGGERVTLYLTGPRAAAPGPAYISRVGGGLDARYWATDRLTCTIVGPVDEATMAALARAVMADLGGGSADTDYGG